MSKTVRYIEKSGAFYIFAADTTEVVKEAKKLHNLSKTATAALGRLSTAALLGAELLKNEKDTLSFRINGKGPLGTIFATANTNGETKGYVAHPTAELPLKSNGKLDVSGGIGKDGFLTVIKDMGLKKPYIGSIPIISGEIAEDITAYYAVSEQIPTVCSLGVLVDKENGDVLHAGGFLIQLLPGVDNEIIDKIENNLKSTEPITTMLFNGLSPDKICEKVLLGFKLDKLGEKNIKYFCSCSRERTYKMLKSTGEKALNEFLEDDKTKVLCNFCDKKYIFSKAEIQKMLNNIKNDKSR